MSSEGKDSLALLFQTANLLDLEERLEDCLEELEKALRKPEWWGSCYCYGSRSISMCCEGPTQCSSPW